MTSDPAVARAPHPLFAPRAGVRTAGPTLGPARPVGNAARATAAAGAVGVPPSRAAGAICALGTDTSWLWDVPDQEAVRRVRLHPGRVHRGSGRSGAP
jgi:hypothetical protein